MSSRCSDQDHGLHPSADGALPALRAALRAGLDGACSEGTGVVSARAAGGGRAPITGNGVDVAWRWLGFEHGMLEDTRFIRWLAVWNMNFIFPIVTPTDFHNFSGG